MEALPATDYPDQERFASLIDKFREEFEGAEPQIVVRVPGRVNLIGEHIDYCGYAVHPMAIEQDVLVAVAKSGSGRLVLENVDGQKYPQFRGDVANGVQVDHQGRPGWWNYFLCGVKGVVEEVLGGADAAHPDGLHALVDGQIPPSAGLSSSSALVVSAAICALWANGRAMGRTELAELCARSEKFIGTQGGGMDQAIEVLAKEGSAKLIEFNPLKATDVTLPSGATFVIANSLSECNKADFGGGSKYNVRVAECRVAAKVLGKALGLPGWRDISTLAELQSKSNKSLCQLLAIVEETLHEAVYTVPEVAGLLETNGRQEVVELCSVPPATETFELRKRAAHVFGEAERVFQFKAVCDSAAAAEAGDEPILAKLGRLMRASHESCAEMFDCSHPRLDELVELSGAHGALGARLTGAGWGGCIVALVPDHAVRDYVAAIKSKYYSRIESVHCSNFKAMDKVIFPTKPSAGAKLFRVPGKNMD